MKEHLEEYLMNQESVNEKKPNTIKMMKLILTDFFEHSNDVSITSIEAWIRSKNGGQKTTKKQYVGILRGYIEYLIDHDYYNGKNYAKIVLNSMGRADDRNPDKRKAFTLDEVKKMIKNTMHPRDRTILLTLAKTGARANELCSIKLSNVNFDDNTIKLTNRKGDRNGSKNTAVPMDRELAESLKLWIQIRGDLKDDALFTSYMNKKMSPISIWLIVKAAAERIGINDGHPHAFRHFFTSILNSNKCHAEVISVLRGDSKNGMVSYYTHLPFEQIRKEYLGAMPRILS